MLDGLRYRFKLWKLQRSNTGITKFYTKERKKALNQQNGLEELELIFHNAMSEHSLVNDEIAQLQSGYLLGQAEKYLIPKPEFKQTGGAWESSKITGLWRLTPHEMSSLRAKVRQERKERSEPVQKWLTNIKLLISLITVLVGALIGVIVWILRN